MAVFLFVGNKKEVAANTFNCRQQTRIAQAAGMTDK